MFDDAAMVLEEMPEDKTRAKVLGRALTFTWRHFDATEKAAAGGLLQTA
jgi:hypothetical protein